MKEDSSKPLLFDKWEPTDFRGGCEQKLIQTYTFPFARVKIESSEVYFPIHLIEARGNLGLGNYNPQELFDPQILEMYLDGKKWMKEKLKEAQIKFPEMSQVDVEKQSYFGRSTAFIVQVDREKLNLGFENVEELNNEVKSVYESLEEHLKSLFESREEWLDPNYLMQFRDGESKTVAFSEGVHLCTANPARGAVNAGIIYPMIISDENASMEKHDSMVQEFISYLEKQHSDVLYAGEVGWNIPASGTIWTIDFSNVIFAKQLCEYAFPRALPEPL